MFLCFLFLLFFLVLVLFLFVCFVLWLDAVVPVSCFLVFVFVSFWGGFKGQVRWPKRPPHLALNPPYLFVLFFVCLFFCFFVFFAFLALFKIEQPCYFP